MRRGFPGLIAVLSAVAGVGGSAVETAAFAAEVYPQRAIRLIVPFPPAGAGDIVGRMLGAKLGEALGQQVVIDNRPGGGQLIAGRNSSNKPTFAQNRLQLGGDCRLISRLSKEKPCQAR